MPEFLLPGVDDAPSTEVGVILMGLDVERLLVGLATAARADEPGLVALSVDLTRHGGTAAITFDDLVDDGLRRWQAFLSCCEPAPLEVTSGSVREAWLQAMRAVADVAPDDVGPATRAYRAACWLRRDDVDRCVKGHT